MSEQSHYAELREVEKRSYREGFAAGKQEAEARLTEAEAALRELRPHVEEAVVRLKAIAQMPGLAMAAPTGELVAVDVRAVKRWADELDAALSEQPSQPGAWIEVEHGDVQRTHPNVPDLPNGRYYLSEQPSQKKDLGAAQSEREAAPGQSSEPPSTETPQGEDE